MACTSSFTNSAFHAKARARSAAVALLASVLAAGCGGGGGGSSTGGGDPGGGGQDGWNLATTDCTPCHSAEASKTETADPALDGRIAATHENASVLKCGGCHTDEATLKSLHATAGGTPPTELTKTTVEEATCLACHGSYAQLAEKTADSTALTDKNGTTVNPHEAPSLTPSHGDITCTSCHSGHGEMQAKDLCLGCHHMDVFECGTCH